MIFSHGLISNLYHLFQPSISPISNINILLSKSINIISSNTIRYDLSLYADQLFAEFPQYINELFIFVDKEMFISLVRNYLADTLICMHSINFIV